MKILSVAHCVPETVLDNQNYLDIVGERNRARFSDREFETFRALIARGFEITGNERRHIAVNGESALDFGREAACAAIEQAGIEPSEIDVVIYAGVARGWIEPATADIFQDAVGAVNATSFDVLDACAGWLRGMHVAHSLLRASAYKTALIIACEFGWDDFIKREFNSIADLDQYFAGFTLGEAATATVLRATPEDDFRFHFRTFPEYHRLCVIPLSAAGKLDPQMLNGGLVPGLFAAHSTALTAATMKCAIQTFEEEPSFLSREYDIFFAHIASKKGGDIVARRLGLPLSIHYPTHAEYGNTASAAIPLAMSLALEERKLERGHRVLVGVTSAGITIGMSSFTY